MKKPKWYWNACQDDSPKGWWCLDTPLVSICLHSMDYLDDPYPKNTRGLFYFTSTDSSGSIHNRPIESDSTFESVAAAKLGVIQALREYFDEYLGSLA